MTYTTTDLGLQLPVPGSGEKWSTSVYNTNLTKLEDAIDALAPKVPVGVAGGTQGSGSIGPNGQIGDISTINFTEAAPRTVLVTLTTTASAPTAASGNRYLRLNGGDIITPTTARQQRLAGGTQNFIALTAVARTRAGDNSLTFAATSDPNGAIITFEQIALGAKAF